MSFEIKWNKLKRRVELLEQHYLEQKEENPEREKEYEERLIMLTLISRSIWQIEEEEDENRAAEV